ncbi:efflux RND transporter periplasmic adaptor subunit [Rehaibacterium terrae]|jgi:RND family efflux transporter MFP subunit|uniref:RND family efflux transporter MFP subunit n=1 Tax=Rehaibacterium terrae TaxID=1341696 RepID=A0A7W7Y225_9GAMM|nr:efflux RND transporter periplasmic adaptor subunit [Rehaibacterium terrae]MBB5016674.1 RND family efflux transporter MFP subunit [Rehaibacterium terrae]
MHRLLALLFAAPLCAAAAVPATAPAAVTVRPLSEVALPAQGSAAASVLSPNDSLIAADVTAKVARVHAEVGSTVRKGQVLIELDASDYRLALAQAQAQEASARANLQLAEQRHVRARQLKDRQFVSDDEVLARHTEVEAARAQLQVAEAARRVAERNVEKCRVLAPFDGAVTERLAQVGALAPAGTPLLRLVDLAAPEIEAHVQAGDAESLTRARELTFESQGHHWQVTLLRLAPVVDQAARTQVARLAFAGDGAPAGSSGTLRWQGAALLLPPQLMVRRGDALGAFVVRDGKARFVAAPDAQEGRPFALDLPPTAQIVVAGHQGLNDGIGVQIDTTGGSR